MERWRFKTGEDPQIYNQAGIQASTVVSDGLVWNLLRHTNFEWSR